MANLIEDGSVRVADLSGRFQVTEETIRRDLEKLARAGLLRKTYGGAVLVRADPPERPFQTRNMEKVGEKVIIAQTAACFIKPRDVIALDASTTALYLARNLPAVEELVVVTNAVLICMELANRPGVRVLCTGGILRDKSLSFVGPLAEQAIHRYNISKAFVSCHGVTVAGGATESNELEAKVKGEMVAAAGKSFLLVDNSKFGVAAFATIAPVDAFNHIITDPRIPAHEIDQLTALGSEVLLAT